MKTLLWKEWREQRLFFFLAIGIITLSRTAPKLIPKRIIDYEMYAFTMCYLILPTIFSLFMGAISFTNEFTRNTRSFLLSQPVTAARLFWVKYLSALVLLFILLLLSHVILFVPFAALIRTGSGQVELPRIFSAAAIFLSSAIILYSAGCFSSLLLKNSLPAILCTPFILLFGILPVIPFLVSLFLISPNVYIFIFLAPAALIAVFLILSFLTWQRAIARDVSSRKLLFKTTFVILLISFGFHAVANLAVSIKLNNAIRQAKMEGIRLTLEEVIPPPVRDKDNAALVYQQAFALAERLKNKYKEEWGYMPYESKIPVEELTTEQKRTISRIMKDPEFVKFYVLLDRAISMPACRFDIKYGEGPAMLLPDLAKMRSMARLIAARTYILAEERRDNEALRSAGTGLQLGNFLADEPIIISQLVRIAQDDISVKSLNLLVNRESIALSVEDYRRLLSILEGKRSGMTKALEGELVFLGRYFFEQQITLGRALGYMFANESKGHRLLGNLYGGYLGSPVLKMDYTFYIRALAETINYSKKTYFAIKDKTDEWERKISPDKFKACKHLISSISLPALSRILVQQARNNANLDSCKLALALKIYREKHGNYPDSLYSVSPEIIPELPLDPFTGKNYIYRREGKGFIVYSVGPNETDDGGVYNPKQSTKYDDIAFKITE
jgi:ABC-type transport system involved in multi-copper enzyme maturation permease subunit